jgi:phospholipid-binding lipoprotein MlaA
MTTAIRRILPVLLALYMALTLVGCATTAATQPQEIPAMHTVKELDDEALAGTVEDPWVSTNKSIYVFNYNLDKYLLLPVVNTYEYILPTFAQTGVSNFFNNIAEIRTLYNSLLQAKGEKALITTSRFLTNSILGIGGLFDPATHFDLKRQNEDFGQTMGVWGVGQGPYFVMPALGPGTVRSAGGFVADTAIHSGIKTALDLPDSISEDHGQEIQTGVTVLKTVDNRHQQSFRYLDNGYPFEYELVRYFYGKSRDLETMK